jgi:hypothetical protein
MRMKQISLLISLLILVLTGACAIEPSTKPTSVQTIDRPSLSPADAISIAQEHSITSPLNIYEKQAGMYARMGGTKGWNAGYIGNGKWTVEFRLRGEYGGLIIHRWSVFEGNLTAVYIGALVE